MSASLMPLRAPTRSAIHASPLDTRRPFTTAQGRAAGITRGQLRGPTYERLFRGVYVRTGTARTPATLTEAAAAYLRTDVIAARHTAAQLWGGIVPHSPDTHVAVPAARRSTIDGLRVSRHDVLPPHRRVGGLLVSTPEATFVQMAPLLPLVELVVLGDSLLRRRATTPEALIAAAAAATGRGARLARAAAGYVRAGVDSPMESRLRMLLVLAGLPEPTVNHTFTGEDGRWELRFDLSYPEVKLAIEYDGRQHAESDAQWQRDVERRQDIDDRQWRVVVVLAKGVYTDPGGTVAQVARLLRERGVPVRVTSGWKRHFPSRG